MNDVDLAFTPINQLRQLLDSRQVSSLELTDLYLQRIEALNLVPTQIVWGAVFYEGTGSGEAYRYNLGAAQAGEKLGAEMLQRQVGGLLSEGDRCLGVTFENGQLKAGLVVLAMGPWIREASQWIGFNIPIRPLKGQIIRLQRVPLAAFSRRGQHLDTSWPAFRL